jgi:hypothetical protein
MSNRIKYPELPSFVITDDVKRAAVQLKESVARSASTRRRLEKLFIEQ